MKNELESLSAIQSLSSEDFERFRACLGILTSKTFIIRGIERERELYDFVLRNFPVFQAWFFCMDAELVKDESLGVAAFRGPGKTRLRFTKEEICAILTLRLLYEDKKKKRETSLAAFPCAAVSEFQQKYNALTGEAIKKTSLLNVLRRLSSCKLIDIESQDIGCNDALIVLYPSIPFCIDRSALDDAVEFLKNRGKAPDTEGGAETGVEEDI